MNEDFLKCSDCVDLLMDYLDGNLDEETKEELQEHFKACPPCVNFLETYRSSTEMIQKMEEQQVQVPEELKMRLKDFLRSNV